MDLYIAPSDAGYWEGAIRADDDPLRPGLLSALAESRPFTIELLYGDQDGGQRTISRFHVLPADDKGWYCQATLHRNIDRPDPRSAPRAASPPRWSAVIRDRRRSRGSTKKERKKTQVSRSELPCQTSGTGNQSSPPGPGPQGIEKYDTKDAKTWQYERLRTAATTIKCGA